MSIYDLIKNEHREVEKLFQKIEGTKDPDERFELFEQVREDLVSHSKAEDSVLYSRLAGELPDKISESRDEHDTIELLLFQLADCEPDEAKFDTLFHQLKQAVQHHVNEEEKELLPKAKKIVGPDDDNSLADRMMQEERRLLDADERGDLDSETERPQPRF